MLVMVLRQTVNLVVAGVWTRLSVCTHVPFVP